MARLAGAKPRRARSSELSGRTHPAGSWNASEHRPTVIRAWHVVALLTMVGLAPVVMHGWFVTDRYPPGDWLGYASVVASVRDAVVAHGFIPVWRPRWFAGSSQFVSSFVEVLAFPFALVLGPVSGTKAMFVVSKIVAGLGMYAIFAHLFAAPAAGIVAGYAYAFGAPGNYQSAIGGHLDVAIAYALFPPLLLASVALLRKPRWSSGMAVGLLLASVLATHYVQAPAAFLVPAVLLLLRPWRTEPGERDDQEDVQLRFAMLGVAIVVFLVLAASTLAWLGADRGNHALMSAAKAEAGQTLLIEQSPFMFVNRNGWLSGWLEEHRPPRLLIDVTDPDFSARRYLGVVAIAVVVVGWLPARRCFRLRRWYQAFGLILVAQYWLSMGPRSLAWQLGRAFRWHESVDAPVRAALTGAAVACAVWAALVFVGRRRRVGSPIAELPLSLAVILFVSAHPIYAAAATILPPLRGLRAPGHFFDLVPFSFYGLMGVALAAIAERIRNPKIAQSVVLTIGLFVAADFWPSNGAFARGVPATPIRELAQTLADVDGDGGTLRVGMYPWFTRDDWIHPTFAAIESQLGLAWGWLDWQAGRLWDAYVRMAMTATIPGTDRALPRPVDRVSDELCRLARIKYLLEEISPGRRLRMTDSWQLHWANATFALWERSDVLPVAYATSSYAVTIADADQPAVAAWASQRNVLTIANVEGSGLTEGAIRTLGSPADASPTQPRAPNLTPVMYRRPAPNDIQLSMGPGSDRRLAFVAEAYHPWWRATVDGRPAPVFRAQYAFMAVPVMPGSHVAELRFVPPLLIRAADAASTVGWFAVPLAIAFDAVRSRRRHPVAVPAVAS